MTNVIWNISILVMHLSLMGITADQSEISLALSQVRDLKAKEPRGEELQQSSSPLVNPSERFTMILSGELSDLAAWDTEFRNI